MWSHTSNTTHTNLIARWKLILLLFFLFFGASGVENEKEEQKELTASFKTKQIPFTGLGEIPQRDHIITSFIIHNTQHKQIISPTPHAIFFTKIKFNTSHINENEKNSEMNMLLISKIKNHIKRYEKSNHFVIIFITDRQKSMKISRNTHHNTKNISINFHLIIMNTSRETIKINIFKKILKRNLTPTQKKPSCDAGTLSLRYATTPTTSK